MAGFETVYRGRLPGERIGGSLKASICEALGLQHDAPGIRLRAFCLVGESADYEQWPDVEFEVVVRVPKWW